MCESERDLLERFIECIRFFDPDILIGWDIFDSSLGYIIARAVEIGMKFYKLCLGRYVPGLADNWDPEEYRTPPEYGIQVLSVNYFNRYRRICTKVDASIFDSALSHTRRSEGSEKKQENTRVRVLTCIG